jgi:multidrug resistance efflux pump
LTAALEQATDLVDELRAEIAEGEALAERYQSDLARYEQLAALKREEVAAIAVEIRSEVRSGDQCGIAVALATNAVIGAVFFGLGLWVQV